MSDQELPQAGQQLCHDLILDLCRLCRLCLVLCHWRLCRAQLVGKQQALLARNSAAIAKESLRRRDLSPERVRHGFGIDILKHSSICAASRGHDSSHCFVIVLWLWLTVWASLATELK